MNVLKLASFLCIGLLSYNSNAVTVIDLTDPTNLEVADQYPSFKEIKIVSFEDSTGIEELDNGNSSIFGLKPNDSDDWRIFKASIAASKEGKQRIYIYTAKTCKDEDEDITTIVIKTNKQNVKYNSYCNGNVYYISPISKAGLNFLISEFKKKENVIFEFSDITVLFDATGFTKKWGKFGGDAI